jgi:hypothetical protein
MHRRKQKKYTIQQEEPKKEKTHTQICTNNQSYTHVQNTIKELFWIENNNI